MTKRPIWLQQSGRLPTRYCPSCHTGLSAVTSATHMPHATPPVPRIGDVTLCVYCGAVLVVTTLDTFRLATQAEVDALPELTKRIAEGLPFRREKP